MTLSFRPAKRCDAGSPGQSAKERFGRGILSATSTLSLNLTRKLLGK